MKLSEEPHKQVSHKTHTLSAVTMYSVNIHRSENSYHKKNLAALTFVKYAPIIILISGEFSDS